MVKIIYSLVGYLLTLTFLISCGERKEVDADTFFKYEDLCQSFDSKTNTYTRKYNADSISIIIVLTKDERELILKSFLDNNFQNFPLEIDCSSWWISPKQYDRLSLNGRCVTYIYNGLGNEGWLCVKGKKFNKISRLIEDVISTKSEVKTLDPSDIYYE